jgi:hypothetical protein
MKKAAFIVFLSFIVSHSHSHPGVGIVEASTGDVYYTDLKQVWKITPTGQLVIAVPDVHTHELYLDENDNLYGEHLWYNGEKKNTWGHYVWKLSPDGRISKVIPDKEGFLEDYSFVRDPAGRMYWVDRSTPCQQVIRKNTDGSISRFATDCFHNIRGMETLREGSVAVVDFQDIKKISPQGRVTTVALKIANKKWTRSSVENQNAVMGIWEDREGNLYAAVLSEGLVKRFRRNGSEEVVLKTPFPWTPSGGMVDSRGNLWVLETNSLNQVRVERRELNGTSTVFKP